eukprot:gene42-701_t
MVALPPHFSPDQSAPILNGILASSSYVADASAPTDMDFAIFSKCESRPDASKFPHFNRWFLHIEALNAQHPGKQWPEGPIQQDTAKKLFAPPRRNAASDDKKKPTKESSNKKEDGGAKDAANLKGKLKNAEMGKVVTRFPPEPSGYMHIGHCKAAMLNFIYSTMFEGKMILRFDDTNPSKEKMEFQESMVADLKRLEIIPWKVTHTSDYFDMLQERMETMIKEGKAYVDNTDVDTMRAQRDQGIESDRRNLPVEDQLKLWKEMLVGSETGLKCCVRAKMDMQNKNKCLRDPVFYRCKVDVPHMRTGDKYKAYPTYDFACPIVDAIEGVTHSLRTIEYKDREPMFHWVIENTTPKVPKVELAEYSRMEFTYTILSKRKLTLFVEKGVVSGWDDPRMPTIQGVLRRGMTVDALKEFVMTQGASKNTNLMEWDKIWAINKQKMDPVVPRYSVVDSSNVVEFVLSDGPNPPVAKDEPLHPKNADLGTKKLFTASKILLQQDDCKLLAEGEQVTLMHWGNAFVETITKNADGVVTGMTGKLNLAGSVKETTYKLNWVPVTESPENPKVTMKIFDHIVTCEKLEDDVDLFSVVNPNSERTIEGIGESAIANVKKGDRMQLERKGYYIVDSVNPLVLFNIPDGRVVKDKKNLKAVDKSSDKKAAADAGAADNNNSNTKKDKKDKKKEKAAKQPKEEPAKRALDDPARLKIVVGEIVKVWPAENSDKLWCELIDVGEKEPRQILSGIRQHVPESTMLGAKVCVLANLKTRKIAGIESQGMVLCASNDDAVELCNAPAGAKIGEVITFPGFEGEPDEKLNEKKGKAPLVEILPHLNTNAKKEACFKDAPFTTSAGTVSCNSKVGAKVS